MTGGKQHVQPLAPQPCAMIDDNVLPPPSKEPGPAPFTHEAEVFACECLSRGGDLLRSDVEHLYGLLLASC